MVRVEEVRINATFKEENVKFRIFIPLMAPDKLLTSGKIYKLSSTVLLPNLLQDVFVHSYKSNYIQLQRLEVNHIHKVGGSYSSKMYSISHTRLDSVTFCKISMRRKMFINSLQMEPREKLAFPNSEGILQKKKRKRIIHGVPFYDGRNFSGRQPHSFEENSSLEWSLYPLSP